jgi:hypothetical protein
MIAPPLIRISCVAGAACALLTACGDPAGPDTADPDAARIVTEDIARFWTAFDKITSATDTMPLRRDYLDAGTAGLRDFTDRRWKNAVTLTAMVWPRRDYYQSVRSNTLQVASLEPELRAIYHRLQDLYPAAVFPDVYFAIGGMSTGGTTSPRGLLIGTELFARADNSPVTSLTPWQRTVIRSTDVLPAIVAHELVHFQQRHGNRTTLLAQAIGEGSADFIAGLLTTRSINEHLQQYGAAHEAELWQEFAAVMDGTDVSDWLYNGGSVTDPGDRPADLGYYVGMRITQAYYDRAADKRAALREILTISDFPAFLHASRYAQRFP